MPKVLFISYSHDNDEHMAWVKKFADDLEQMGDFEVLLDQNLPKGYSFTRFMESGLANADKVLVIGTPEYKIKAETGKGVAFEESIISAELMQDIDTIKYYPILRSGSFNTSFPPILQGRNGDDMSDDCKYEAVLTDIVNAIANERAVPSVLSGKINRAVEKEQTVADVYFTENLLLETDFGMPNGRILGVSFSVTVTNLAKEARYYSQPSFKVSIPFEGTADTFLMLNILRPISFPVKLEYGQQFSVDYKLTLGNIEMFARLLQKDSNATIKTFVTTSLKERAESEPYPLSKVVANGKYVK